VHAPTRAAAISRMSRALDALVLTGVESSVLFHRRVMDEPDFRAGSFSIRYLEQHPELVEVADSASALRAAAVAAALLEEGHRRLHRTSRISGNGSNAISAWRASGWPWRRERP
jgi:acetyl/propionyl-CoA carboxylase alpha subunit